MDVEMAREDLAKRTLAQIANDFARLAYLASLRDCSTGEYHHHGLARSFCERAAREALALSHQEVFRRLVNCPLQLFVGQVEQFLRSIPQNLEKTISSWESLEVSRLMVPLDADPVTAALFQSNVKVTMALLKSRLRAPSETARDASPRRLLDR